MPVELVKLPDVGEGVAEAEIVEWHVAVGMAVQEDQILAAVMTDKATVEIPSPRAGVVVELGAELGARLAVGSPLVGIKFGSDAQEPDQIARPDGHAGTGESRIDPQVRPTIDEGRDRAPRPHSENCGPAANGEPRLEPVRPVASPAVRARAREAGVDLRLVSGSGPAGRITHDDLVSHLRGRSKVPIKAPIEQCDDKIDPIKVIGLRRRIAERMAEATRRVAHFSYVEEIDVTDLEALRQQLNTGFADTRPKLTVLPFVVAALARAVREFPQVNGTYDDDNEVIVRHSAVHVGIATQTASGLMVPVLFHAEARDPWSCAEEIRRLATAARDGTVLRQELSGSTITVTSLGDLGGIATTPVVNRPELAIIGVNRMMIRPLWRGTQFVPRWMMNLSSSFDHRIIDGYEAAQFIRRMKELLEAPALLLVGN
ncbi:dihydrolipoamide acetyltransferase family protein [Bradyrhizobium sp. GCM10027634]|uniref:dihydrolipoamide acetyltransferase family protein n=1 Tax=unclassified Bradyrhizobium TaxID=2631580 RepID=UPI00188C7C78|nr:MULTISPECIES: dihydrolipoamide acetyltransferase family protein [unclassified Bradyrhizobium]MDN4999866.1 dihydrolipoamide acetyltransferase family protein [Bradyrhizobium sp. WYCCWR 12677]QOZ43240.1 2-oxo acid dehydrogenase subunit E2 [Bradyrhizobium sp. CCBAU 53340]